MRGSGSNPVRPAPNDPRRKSGNPFPEQRVGAEDDLQHHPVPAEQGGPGAIQKRSG